MLFQVQVSYSYLMLGIWLYQTGLASKPYSGCYSWGLPCIYFFRWLALAKHSHIKWKSFFVWLWSKCVKIWEDAIKSNCFPQAMCWVLLTIFLMLKVINGLISPIWLWHLAIWKNTDKKDAPFFINNQKFKQLSRKSLIC